MSKRISTYDFMHLVTLCFKNDTIKEQYFVFKTNVCTRTSTYKISSYFCFQTTTTKQQLNVEYNVFSTYLHTLYP